VQLWHGLGVLAGYFWRGPAKWRAWTWTAITFLFALASSGYAVLLSFLQRMFWNVLQAKDPLRFQKVLVFYLVAVLIGPGVIVLFQWAKERMSLAWRYSVTGRFLENYMSDSRYFRIMGINESLDNPDQRIAEDIRQVSSQAVELMCAFLVGIIDAALFSFILYKIYPPLYMFLIGYAVLGTVVTLVFGRGLISLNSVQLSKEADFRYSLVRVRENAESIAFYEGSAEETKTLMQRFDDALRNKARLVRYSRDLGFFTTAYRYFVQIIPSILIGPMVLTGKMPLGMISQAYFS